MKEIEYWIYTIAVIILVVACAISGGVLAVTGDTPNLYHGDDMVDNPIHRPIGGMLGMERDTDGHWRAR